MRQREVRSGERGQEKEPEQQKAQKQATKG